MQKTTLTQSEAKIQQEIVRWYKNEYCLAHHNPRSMIFAVPNESNQSRAMKLIQTGMYAGCADLVVIHNQDDEYNFPTKTLFIEVKTPTGIQSPKQKLFEAHCKQINIPYHIVRSLDEFKAIVERL